MASSYQHVFSDRWLNEVRLGETRRTVSRGCPARYAGLGMPGLPSTARFADTLPTFLIAEQNARSRSVRRLHMFDFGPRLGVVVRLTPKTIVSSGYGRVFIEQAGITTPFTAAFAVTPQFAIGTALRNPVRGPSYRNVDLVPLRRVPAPHGTSVEIRGEAFNLINAANLGAPSAVVGAANFGTITTALDPRVVQFALQILFCSGPSGGWGLSDGIHWVTIQSPTR